MTDPLIDRLLSLAPLAVLAYMLRRNEAERSRMLGMLREDRESFRNERRELINRVQFPQRMPTGSAPIPAQPEQSISRAELARQAASRVGRAAPAMFPAATPKGDADEQKAA